MKPMFAAGLALALTLTGGAVTVAEPSPAPQAAASAPLRASLAHVPAGPDAWGPTVSWVDLRAVADARPGAAHPASIEAALAAADDGDLAARRWFAALMGVTSGPADLLQLMLVAGRGWPGILGFDAAAIERLTAFGSPPANGTVVEGGFDPAAIGDAFAARGFIGHEDAGFTWWCSPDGCDAGITTDLGNAERTDPFGGRFGRRQPIAVAPDVLLSAASDGVVASMAGATSGASPALADDPLVRLVLDGLDATADGWLIQVELVPGTSLASDVAELLGPNMAPEQAEALLATLGDGGEPLAPPSILLLADGATETEQVVRVVLGYPTLADAEQAARVLPARPASTPSLLTEEPWQVLLDRAGVSSVTGEAVPAGDGAAAVIALHAPIASSEPDPETGELAPSSRVYGLLTRALWARDLLWLVPGLGGA